MRAALPIVLLLAGCTLGPDYRRPDVDLPAGWRADAPAAAAAKSEASRRLRDADAAAGYAAPAAGDAALLDTAWWSTFGDPQLESLIRTAVDENKELRIAALRIEQADAFLQVAQADQWPQVGYDGSRTRNSLSENRQVKLSPGTRPVDNDVALSLRANWELDLWGKVRRANESAYADLVASEETRRGLMLSIVAEVASSYIRLRALDEALALLQSRIATQREQVRLAEAAYSGGRTQEQPVVAALADLQQWQAELPPREAEIAALENALSVLLGRNPGPIARGKAVGELQLPQVPAGVPAQILAQRPDVRQAEQQLVSANARIGVQKAQYLPTISLTGSNGYASTHLSDLNRLSSNFGTFGVTLLGPIFDAGRIAGQVREAEAVQKQAAVTYARSVQTALREVEDALVKLDRYGRQAVMRAAQVRLLREQRELVQKRFEGGRSSFYDVLDADRALNAGLQSQNDTRREQLAAVIAIYKAMGGGWSLPELRASRPETENSNRP